MVSIFASSTNKSRKWLIRIFCSSKVVYCDHIRWKISYFVHIDWDWRIVLSVDIVLIYTGMRDMIWCSFCFNLNSIMNIIVLFVNCVFYLSELYPFYSTFSMIKKKRYWRQSVYSETTSSFNSYLNLKGEACNQLQPTAHWHMLLWLRKLIVVENF